ncbi:hypothetical protein E1A90_10295 [Bacillus mycoides]|nr:hypothetical protein E1A90_10295 [Bacillus mycoides]
MSKLSANKIITSSNYNPPFKLKIQSFESELLPGFQIILFHDIPPLFIPLFAGSKTPALKFSKCAEARLEINCP